MTALAEHLFDGIRVAMRVRRARLRITQHTAAGRAGLNARHWGEIERGQRRPTLATVAQIAHGLDMSLPALIEEAIGLAPDTAAQRDAAPLRTPADRAA